jgi:pimeloyl-ACP methyl ester carboxylesterase
MKRQSLCVLVLLAVGGLTGRALAQAERYELGRRLGFFERAWDKPTDDASRKRAVAFVEQVPLTAILGNLGEAGKAFDRARWALVNDKGYSPEVQWAESLLWVPESRLVDAGETELPFTVRKFYESKAAAPSNKSLRMTILTALTVKPAEIALGDVPFTGKLPLAGVPPGDHVALVQVVVDKKIVSTSAVGFALVKDLKQRLGRLRQAVAGFGRGPQTVEQLTVRETLSSLQALANKEVMEIDYPAARQLKEAEAVLEAIADSKKFYGPDKTGQFWMRVPVGKGSTALRLLVPDSAKDAKALPLVIALHGLTASENLYFEAYGAGLLLKLCQERGWLVVAPHTANAGTALELIDELARIYPVDKERVFVLGHSLGAGQAVKAAELAPQRIAAVGALGGGAAVKPKEAPTRVAFFIGVGSKDLALLAARGLRHKLDKAGVTTVEYKEYTGIEHLLVVREALPDLFALFDRVAKAKK